MNILKVCDVEVVWFKSNPPQLLISAQGLASTPGWSNPQLKRREYPELPQDGVQDFDFVADPPEGPVPEVICHIAAQVIWSDPPRELKGIRVHAKRNSVQLMLGQWIREITVE